ncbi:WD40 repeat domain-containing protein [Nocardiopsis coralliicola]
MDEQHGHGADGGCGRSGDGSAPGSGSTGYSSAVPVVESGAGMRTVLLGAAVVLVALVLFAVVGAVAAIRLSSLPETPPATGSSAAASPQEPAGSRAGPEAVYRTWADMDIGAVADHLVFSPDGRRLFGKGNWATPVVGVDLRTGEELFRVDGEFTGGLALSPDGSRLAVGDFDAGAVRILDPATGEETARLEDAVEQGTGVPRAGMAFADAGTLAVGQSETGLRLWDADSGEPGERLAEPLYGGDAVQVARDGRILLGGAVIDPEAPGTDEPLTLARTDEVAAGIALAPRADRAAGQGGGKVWFWDTSSGKVLGDPVAIGGTDDSRRIAYHPGGGELLVWGRGTLLAVDTGSGSTLGPVQFRPADAERQKQGVEGGLAFSADGSRMAAGTLDGAEVWDWQDT